MCGIVGVLGKHEAAPILIDALKRLEYRGYDSSGIAIIDKGQLSTRREVGKLVNLSDSLVHAPLSGMAGIGHTRWATHGAASYENAHPHGTERVSLVHNGIIENYTALRTKLREFGIECKTETDTETVVLLVDYFLSKGTCPREAVKEVIKCLEGAYALCFLFQGEDDLMIAARNGAPLAIGYGDGEMFIGSDASVLGTLTNRISYLKDGDYAFITRENTEIFDRTGKPVNRAIDYIQTSVADINKAGHKHFMSKEIFEQPQSFERLLNMYWNAKKKCFREPLAALDFSNLRRIQMSACGTAYLACLIAKYWFESEARIPVQADIASEFRYRSPIIEKDQLNIFISQSGETADTLAAMKYCADSGAKSIGIVNTERSSIAQGSDLVLPIHVGPEIGVASTKAFTGQLGVLHLLMLKAAHDKKQLSDQDLWARIDELFQIPALMSLSLGLSEKIAAITGKLVETRSALFLGRGVMYPLALEGALKLKEISYIHAEGFPSGELKHGPIALVDKNTPIVVFAPLDSLFEKNASNVQEVIARGGKVLFISDRKGQEKLGICWQTITLPEVSESIAPILYALPAQLLAYHSAVAKGTDVDQPRNLAKSVTVE